ncbi:MAG: bifunctional (p)ppGpp synthetase/guanosine-3',5'-bis(diphosphate) 3'-pyrophosphohydrolase [Phreatobacter sp.]|uniref:RelA/SpoT family protein n=1 Tax=Phreatobacter sp. TaxID=1966341 RepID=UPI00273483C6|nr:bifunctional (p)ppGpp synthetase/guanosine-3',5'-bis(diphosphate) 3'-pyrophosphohydrolase [Phreatobacter sp.]MDP2800596.1 bifunctional (p)ppGpp synthetase/guanosine-3',5'-bis(diphosphate) 3'-pyrophosphohydrolase [Phreatobacter sp.]
MMRQYELVERVKRYNPKADEALLDRAYVYAMLAHGTQKRASGDPYFSHPLEVAAILTDLKVDDATIVSALLHDTIEDTAATKDDIREKFGAAIAELVDGLTKLKKLDLVSKQAVQAENLRKLLLAITSDVRVLLVKLADRLHNMRTLHYVPPAKRDRVAQETLDIYAPLAGRMGMHDMREELEDLAFRQINAEAYEALKQRLDRQRAAAAAVIEEIETQLARKLAGEGISAEVTGRLKKPYSIYRKMERKSVSFEQLSDIVAFRILVDDIPACYAAVGIIHTTWPAVPLRFKDYISTPKGNDYRSLHTTVIGPQSQRVEMQIRTSQMHEIAEYGIAAHALYKDDAEHAESTAYAWLRRMVEMLAHADNPEEFLEHTKLELFSDQVYCFTPKGRLIALPRKANCIDFAYAVHTDIGNQCARARINGVERPLVTELQNGDEVEIITDPKATPSPAWENIVVTGRARSAIRRATRVATRAQYLELGRQIVQTLFTRAGKSFSDDIVRQGLKRLARVGVEDVYWAVGRNEMPEDDVLKAVYPDFKSETPLGPKPTADWFGVAGETALKFQVPESEGAIPIRGINLDLPVRFSRESGAVPGDRIVGIMTPGEGITIFPIQSPALAAYDNEPERWLDVRWDVDSAKRSRYPARIAVKSRNAPGSLAAVTQVIADNDGNIDNLRMQRTTADYTNVAIDVEVWDLKHLNAIIAGIRTLPMTAEAQRVFE